MMTMATAATAIAKQNDDSNTMEEEMGHNFMSGRGCRHTKDSSY